MNIKGMINKFSNSALGYMPVKIMDGILGVVMIKVYTTLFSPDPYAVFNLINPVVAIVFMLSLGWLNKSTTYFTSQYTRTEQDREKFFSSAFLTWGAILASLSVLFMLYHFIFPPFMTGQNMITIWILIFALIGYSMNQILITLLLYLDLKKISNILLLCSGSAKILLTYILHGIMGEDAMAIFISHASVDLVTGLIAMTAMDAFRLVHIKRFSGELFKRFFIYGYPLIGLSLVSSILNLSDRYIIKFNFDNATSGIYMANYTIAASIFTMIMMGLNRGVYPAMLRAWAVKDTAGVEKKMTEGSRYFIMIGLPAALGLTLLSETIASIFLDPDYLSGHLVIGIVGYGYFFLGLTEYANKGWEIIGKTLYILRNCIVATIANILLNLIFIPIYGSLTAAFTTVIAFMIYFSVSFFRRNREIQWKLPGRSLINMLLANVAMAISVLVLKNLLSTSIIEMLMVITVAVLVYFGTLFLTGEIKEEIKHLHK